MTFVLVCVLQYIYAAPNQVDVVKGAVIPYCEDCPSKALEQGLGLVGAVIMPHNLYLHSGLVLVSSGMGGAEGLVLISSRWAGGLMLVSSGMGGAGGGVTGAQ